MSAVDKSRAVNTVRGGVSLKEGRGNGAKGVTLDEDAAKALVRQGQEAGLPDTGRGRSRAGRARARHGADRRVLPRARRAPHRGRRGRAGRGGGRRRRSRRRPRCLDRFAPALPQGHRQGPAAHRRPGGRALEANRARRPPREAADGRGEPPPRRLDREELPQPGPALPRPDPGGDDRARPRGGEVRLPQGLQVLDVRDVVDPAGGRPRARGQGAHDPHARARRREAEQDRPRRAQAPRRARARPDRG